MKDNYFQKTDILVKLFELVIIMSITIPLRKDIPREHTWSVETIFPSDETWAAEFDSLSRDLPSLEKFKGKITLNAKALVEWFEASEAIQFRRAGVA